MLWQVTISAGRRKCSEQNESETKGWAAGCSVEEVSLRQGGHEKGRMYIRMPRGERGSPACILIFDHQANSLLLCLELAAPSGNGRYIHATPLEAQSLDLRLSDSQNSRWNVGKETSQVCCRTYLTTLG